MRSLSLMASLYEEWEWYANYFQNFYQSIMSYSIMCNPNGSYCRYIQDKPDNASLQSYASRVPFLKTTLSYTEQVLRKKNRIESDSESSTGIAKKHKQSGKEMYNMTLEILADTKSTKNCVMIKKYF